MFPFPNHLKYIVGININKYRFQNNEPLKLSNKMIENKLQVCDNNLLNKNM